MPRLAAQYGSELGANVLAGWSLRARSGHHPVYAGCLALLRLLLHSPLVASGCHPSEHGCQGLHLGRNLKRSHLCMCVRVCMCKCMCVHTGVVSGPGRMWGLLSAWARKRDPGRGGSMIWRSFAGAESPGKLLAGTRWVTEEREDGRGEGLPALRACQDSVVTGYRV